MRKLFSSVLLVGSLTLLGQGCMSTTQVTTPSPAPIPAPAPTPAAATFDQAASIKIGEAVLYPDGLNIMLEKIDDSRCPAGVQCIWAGELAPTIKIQGGDIKDAQQLRLGTMLAPDHVLGMYKIVLKDADTSSISLVVSKSTK